jgi:malyl-CoA/(S)-citramalyl-CoA lyase
MDLGTTALWTRINSLESPWVLDDITRIVGEIGHKLDVIMVPKVEGPWDIHYMDRLLAQLEAKAGIDRPIQLHALLETALGVNNIEDIATASPRMQGMSLGPADLAASRRMKTTRVGGGHPVYGPFGDIKDVEGCETQFRSAFIMGCVGAWSLHPVQIEIAKKVFSPDPDEVRFAKRVIEAIPDGRGVHMIDGKMQDDATWKQCRVMVDLAEMLARKDPELAEAYEMEGAPA